MNSVASKNHLRAGEGAQTYGTAGTCSRVYNGRLVAWRISRLRFVVALLLGLFPATPSALCIANGSVTLEALNSLCCLRATGGAAPRNTVPAVGRALQYFGSSDQCTDVVISDTAEGVTAPAHQFEATPILVAEAPVPLISTVAHQLADIHQTDLNVTVRSLQSVFLRC